ncbi:MAG: TlpA family protein disulfide reductase [Flavobacteriales bacterium]|nr:TlpA family protein disulfide reductase [Flavobacteriales bacterium]
MHKFFLFLLCLLGELFTLAQPVVIEGLAKGYEGRKIVAFQIEDYISEKRSVIASSDIAENGLFSLEFKPTTTGAIILSISRTEATIYASPGAHYSIIFPIVSAGTVKKFDKTSVEVSFEGLDTHDINALIRSFNADYAAFIAEHHYDFAAQEYHGSDAWLKSLGEKSNKTDLTKRAGNQDSSAVVTQVVPFREVVTAFVAATHQKYQADYSNDFFQDYVKYSLGELELLSGMNRIAFYHDYFMSQKIQPAHPSYMSCFHAYYHHFLTQRKKELQSAIIKAVNQERDPMKIVSLFEGDSTCLGTEVRTLAVIKGLHDIYYDKTFTKYSVEKTLMNFPAAQTELKTISRHVLDELRQCQEGWILQDFTLPDEAGDKWHLAEHLGSPVYMVFFASWSSSALKELQIMQNLYEKYGKQILFVAICMDDDYQAFKEYIVEHKDQKFTFLYGGGAPMLSYDCEVRSIPHALMLDSEGKVMYAFTRKPSEGIQLDLEKIVAVMKQSTQGPKTWKQ